MLEHHRSDFGKDQKPNRTTILEIVYYISSNKKDAGGLASEGKKVIVRFTTSLNGQRQSIISSKNIE